MTPPNANSREKSLSDIAQATAKWDLNVYGDDIIVNWEEVTEAVAKESLPRQDGWVDVEVGYPPHAQTVLVYSKEGGSFEIRQCRLDTQDRFDCWEPEPDLYEPVSHWRNLPPAPKGKG